jgi:hypothetical protein
MGKCLSIRTKAGKSFISVNDRQQATLDGNFLSFDAERITLTIPPLMVFEDPVSDWNELGS